MTDDQTTEGPDLKKLPKLHDRILTRLAKVDGAREDMKEIYAQAKDQHFHMRALKLTIRLSKMEPLERYDFLASFNDYCDALGLTGHADILGDVTKAPQPAPVEVDDSSDRSFNWECGREAAIQGEPASACPWAPGVRAYDSWSAGHAAGMQEVADGLVDAAQPKAKARKRNGTSTEQPAA